MAKRLRAKRLRRTGKWAKRPVTVASRFQALSDEVQDNKSKLGALQNLLGAENNQKLIREYEIIDTDFERVRVNRYEERGIIVVWFIKHPHEPDDINQIRFNDIFTLKENLMLHLFEEPVDNLTLLRIK